MKSTKLFVLAVLTISFMITSIHAETVNNSFWTNQQNMNVSEVTLKAGESGTVRLSAEIPDNKTLKAYSVIIYFDETIMALNTSASPHSAMKPKMISSDSPGSIVINSFDVKGVTGKSTAIADIVIKGVKSGSSSCNVLFTAFGENADDQFLPKSSSLQVNVE
jgi:hypothetical protein